VMGRAPGGSQAGSCAVLLQLAEKIAAAREHTSVLVLATAGDEWNDRGTREALELFNWNQKDAGKAVEELKGRVAEAAAKERSAERVLAGLQRVAAKDFGGLEILPARTAIENELLRESSRVEEALQRARVARDEAKVSALQAEKEGILSA